MTYSNANCSDTLRGCKINWQTGSKIEAKEGLVKLDRKSCKKTDLITIPYSNDSQNVRHGWLVSCFTGVPKKNAKLLAPMDGESK